jgi:catechol 2,3-dioxygenase
VELYRDRPPEEWPRDERGGAAMAMDAELDLESLLAEAPPRG